MIGVRYGMVTLGMGRYDLHKARMAARPAVSAYPHWEQTDNLPPTSHQ